MEIEEKEKVFLFNDVDQWEYNLKKQNEHLDILNKIKAIAVDALGEIDINHIELFNDPEAYLINEYWDTYCTHKAPHLKRNADSIIQNETGISLSELSGLHNSLNGKLRKEFRPKITRSGYKATLKQNMFDRFLNDDLADHFDTLKEWIKLTEKLATYSNMPTSYYLHAGFKADTYYEGTEVKARLQKFMI